jgi:hypothetical protein
MSGPAFGSANAAIGPSSLDAALIADREKEGGGGVSERPREVRVQPATGGEDHSKSPMHEGVPGCSVCASPVVERSAADRSRAPGVPHCP